MAEHLPPPHIQLIQMASGHWLASIMYVAADLRLADHIGDGAKSAAELAELTGSHAKSLHRLLRTLAGFGVFTEREPGRFALTELGKSLKSGASGSARATILSFAGPAQWRAWGEFPYSVKTGKTGMSKAHGMEIFDYLEQHPDEASLFSEAMVGVHGPEPPTVADAYDFSGFGTIVDVGGATGNMLAHILAKHAGPKGILYDRPHVTVDAPAFLAARGVADRVSIQSGNFFDSVPEGGDAYILSHIIHDWSEEQCLTILGNCRKAMKPGSKLLIVEFVLPPGDTPHFGKLADMVMLAIPGGEERTEGEYDQLLAKAGFKLLRVVPTASPVSIVEACVA